MNKILKPCPFCGGEHIESRLCDYGGKKTGGKPHLVCCMKCRICVEAYPGEARAKGYRNRKECAEAKWNMRKEQNK